MKNSHILLAALAFVGIACTKELPESAQGLQESPELSAKLVGEQTVRLHREHFWSDWTRRA